MGEKNEREREKQNDFPSDQVYIGSGLDVATYSGGGLNSKANSDSSRLPNVCRLYPRQPDMSVQSGNCTQVWKHIVAINESMMMELNWKLGLAIIE